MDKLFGSISVKVYLLLSCVFCSIYVTGNLIGQKFIHINFFNIYHPQISVGVLLYPVTFIITDLITEFFGKKWASYTVKAGLTCDIIILGLIYLSDNLPATGWSPVNDAIFTKVFSVYGLISAASLLACYIAQSIDIMLFTYIKKLTGKQLMWVRCNVSTIIAQFVDTMTVIGLLCLFGLIPPQQFIEVSLSSFLFKLVASVFFSTPLFYLGFFIIKKLTRKQSHDDSNTLGSMMPSKIV